MMDRLTGIATTETSGIYKGENVHVEKNTAYLKNTAFTINDLTGNATKIVQKAISLLAKYEDTGLTPEEVVSLNTFTDSQCEKLLAKNGELEKEIKRLQIKLGDMGTVCHGCPYPRKYKKLEKQLAHYKQLETYIFGDFTVLYLIEDKEIIKVEIRNDERISWCDNSMSNVFLMSYDDCGDYHEIPVVDIGETAFFTREEAERALKEREQ